MKTGDTVYVRSLDETWTVAIAENGWITCVGWPETMVPESDCELRNDCTPRDELDLLCLMAAGSNGPMNAYARRRLDAMREAGALP